MSGAAQPNSLPDGFRGQPSALAASPPRFVMERDADGALLAVWSNPPPNMELFDALELREIAVALFDMARVIDAERAREPRDERDVGTLPDPYAAPVGVRDRSRGIH